MHIFILEIFQIKNHVLSYVYKIKLKHILLEELLTFIGPPCL